MDMDGVLAEVSQSYRVAIEKTCHAYGASSVTQETITEWKARGNANCDWTLSHNLIRADPNGNKDCTFEEVKGTFEDLYQGKGDVPGLYTLETLIPSRENLVKLKKLSPLGVGIVTGRPRSDCTTFLREHDLLDLVDACVCTEDGPSKPDPFPVIRCCELLGVTPSPTVVLVGDTPDDCKAAVAAGCSAVGVVTPEVAQECDRDGSDYSSTKLATAMSECGADVILPPGFSGLIDMFCDD